MRLPTFALFALLPLLSLYQSVAPQGDLRALLESQVTAVRDLPVEELWRRAASLRDLARASTEGAAAGSFDAEIDRLLAAPDSLSEGAKLFLAGLRLAGSDTSANKLALVLDPLLDSKRDEVAIAAAGLLADAQFKTLDREPKKALLARLTAKAEDASRSPALRLECAYALFEQGGGDERRLARKEMTAFLASEDAELRAQGALALARTHAEITGELYDELRELALLPDERGNLAESFLEKERVREELNRKLKRAAELYASEPSDKAEVSDSFDQLKQVVRMIEQAHLEGDKVTEPQLLEAAMDGMLRSLDEHSSYLSPKDYARFEQELEAEYGGIGAYVGEDRDDGLFTITHPIYSGPAYKAGLQSEDKIVRIDDWSTVGKPVDEVIKKLKGRPGTPLKLYVWRRGMDASKIERPTDDMIVEVKRESITIPPVQYQMLPGKIGMVVLREFSRVASDELRKPLIDLMDQGMQGLIFDLRGNAGGLLDEAVEVAGLFLPKGSSVVSTESRIEETKRLVTRADPVVPAEVPIAVLVNRYSASASEIVSGALQDHQRATIVGQRSFGKGSVQNLIPVLGVRDDQFEDENHNGRWDNWERITRDWNGNGEFDYAPRVKMTIAKYLLPSGRSIHHEIDKDGNEISPGGVEPDTKVEARRIDGWRLEEMVKLRDSHAPRDYVDRYWGEYKERFFQIAENDRKDTKLYPMFDDFVASLNSPLPADDVRQMLRMEIRRRVQDARGKEFPQGDFVEDLQLQEAIRVVLAARGEQPEHYEEYLATIPPSITSRGTVAVGNRDEMRDTLNQIQAARRSDGKLDPATLARLVQILQSSLDK